MATITVMKNYVMKKAQSSSDENLKKIAKILKSYNKLAVEDKKKISVATEKLYTKLKAQETKAPAPKKSASAPKTSGSKKKIATQDLKSVIAKFKQKVGAKVWKQATSGTTSVKQDAERPALPKGKRFSKITGKPYWENRANRSDVKQPPKTYPRLAKGGQTDEKPLSFYKYETPKVKIAWKGKIQPLGMFKSGEEAMEVIKKRINGDYEELKNYSIVTPDKVLHYGKEFTIKYADGDITDMGGLQFIEWKGEEIMYEPTYKEYFFNERKYMSLESAKKAVEKAVSSGGADQSHLRGAYSRGLFSKGGEVGKLIDRERVSSYDEMLEEEIVNSFEVKYSDKHDRIVIESEIFKEENDYTLHEGTIHLTEKGLFQLEDILGVLATDIKNSKYAKGGEVGAIGKFKYEITMANNIEGPFVIAKFIAKGDALICLNALQKATSTKGMRYTLKEVK